MLRPPVAILQVALISASAGIAARQRRKTSLWLRVRQRPLSPGDNYHCRMMNSRNLGFHLHRIAWSVVTEELSRGQITPADPWLDSGDPWEDPEGSESQRRTGCLELLYVYTRMIRILQRRIDWTVNEAIATGASYGDIASVCGTSRQAARQRWVRRRQRGDVRTMRPVMGLVGVGWDGVWPDGPPQNVKVRLVGGPRDGSTTIVKPGQISRMEMLQQPGSGSAEARIARYVPTDDDQSVYTFDGLETAPIRSPSADSRGPKPRVYEIATEFGVKSKEVMAKLQAMGEFVRSASSTVEPDALRELWEHFAAREVKPDT